MNSIAKHCLLANWPIRHSSQPCREELAESCHGVFCSALSWSRWVGSRESMPLTTLKAHLWLIGQFKSQLLPRPICQVNLIGEFEDQLREDRLNRAGFLPRADLCQNAAMLASSLL